MRFRVVLTRKRVGVLVVLLGLAGAGVAYATIPGSNGVINGCYGKITGNLRVIDPQAGERCSVVLEKPLSWNAGGAR
jgi:hypothetical protein